MKITEVLTESSKVLVLGTLPYSMQELVPVMSKATLDYHYSHLAAGYVTKYNAGEGDKKFNEAGAFLHNIFFPQLQPPKSNNTPAGISKELIEQKYKNFGSFKQAVADVAMGIQGSGWVYMSKSGDIKTITNHQIRTDIALLIDWWEHAWALDYEHDKAKYLKNIWRVINWDIVNVRLT
jgi:superoxide dismutase, Fe-Mn family